MTSAPAWPDVDIAGALELIRTGDLSVVNLLEAHLTRIGALDGVIHAVITATAETARQAAREIDARGRLDQQGSLSGIPIGIKDNFETAAVRTTAATKALAGHVPRRSAVVVDRLRRAGALSIGKLNMDELALGGPSGSDVGGIMVNPWDGIGSPGGSSGGSAAAVAASYCMAATGSDTGGSIRNPAGWCGVAGFKPTQGAVSTRGMIPVAWSLDTVGFLARSVDDCALLFAATADRFGEEAAGPRAAFVDRARMVTDERWRIGVATATFDESDDAVRAALSPALRRLADIGDVDEVRLPSLDDAMVAMLTISACEVRSYWDRVFEQDPDSFGAEVRSRLELGGTLTGLDYVTAQRLRQELRDQVRSLFERFDVIVLPTMGFVPGPDPFPGALGGPDHPEWRLSGRYTSLWSLTGNPVISLPAGFTESGRPISLQIVGPVRRDGRLLQVAAAAERAWSIPRDRLVPTWAQAVIDGTAPTNPETIVQ